MSVVIRDATPQDRAAIIALAFEFGGYLAWKDPQKLIVRDEEFGERMAAQIEHQASIVLIAERNGDVGGFAAGAIDATTARILHLYVGGQFGGAGLGPALAEELLTRFVAAGCTEVVAETLAANDTARAFYERLGLTARTVEYRKPLP